MNHSNKKIISVFVCLLFLVGMIPITVGMSNYADEPELEVNDEQTSPVIKIESTSYPYPSMLPIFRVFILNVGDADATDVEWSFKWEGGWILWERFNDKARIDTGEISVITPGAGIVLISHKFGFGRVAIVIHAECAEGSSDTLVIEARMLGFFLIIR